MKARICSDSELELIPENARDVALLDIWVERRSITYGLFRVGEGLKRFCVLFSPVEEGEEQA